MSLYHSLGIALVVRAAKARSGVDGDWTEARNMACPDSESRIYARPDLSWRTPGAEVVTVVLSFFSRSSLALAILAFTSSLLPSIGPPGPWQSGRRCPTL